jgi:hypothetical protein
MLPVICDGGLLSLANNLLNYITTVGQVHDLIDLFRNALGFLRVLGSWNPSASMNRKSRILIVSFIQVISHGKVGR